MVGHFAKDELIVDGQGEISSGGGVYYGSMVLRQMGYQVAVATRLHPDDFPRLEELRQAGVQVYRLSGSANFGHRQLLPVGQHGAAHLQADRLCRHHDAG